jgi:hypothetical protein
MNANSYEAAGRFPLRIEFRPLLVQGVMGNGPNTIFIFLADNLNKQAATHTLWHELVHVLFMAAGKKTHDEVEIEEIAMRLAQVCPDILDRCGFGHRWPG